MRKDHRLEALLCIRRRQYEDDQERQVKQHLLLIISSSGAELIVYVTGTGPLFRTSPIRVRVRIQWRY